MRRENEKTFLVYKVFFVKFQLNSVNDRILPVNGGRVKRDKGAKVMTGAELLR